MPKYNVVQLDGFGGIASYLEIRGKIHHWGQKCNATQLSYKSAIKIAASLNKSSSHSAYTIVGG